MIYVVFLSPGRLQAETQNESYQTARELMRSKNWEEAYPILKKIILELKGTHQESSLIKQDYFQVLLNLGKREEAFLFAPDSSQLKIAAEQFFKEEGHKKFQEGVRMMSQKRKPFCDKLSQSYEREGPQIEIVLRLSQCFILFQKQEEKALKILEKVAPLENVFPEVTLWKAKAYQALDKTKESLELLDKLEKKLPISENRLAWWAEQKSRHQNSAMDQDSLKLLREILVNYKKKKPSNLRIQLELIRTANTKPLKEKELKIMRDLLSAAPSNSEITRLDWPEYDRADYEAELQKEDLKLKDLP